MMSVQDWGAIGELISGVAVVITLAYLALLPTRPLFAGVARAPEIARWGACMMLGAVITAAMFLAMQISIVIG